MSIRKCPFETDKPVLTYFLIEICRKVEALILHGCQVSEHLCSCCSQILRNRTSLLKYISTGFVEIVHCQVQWVKQLQIQTYIDFLTHFPSNLRITITGIYRTFISYITVQPGSISGTCQVDCRHIHKTCPTNIVITNKPPRSTNLHVRENILQRFKERFLTDVISHCNRREESPTVSFGKILGTIVTHIHFRQIFPVVSIRKTGSNTLFTFGKCSNQVATE